MKTAFRCGAVGLSLLAMLWAVPVLAQGDEGGGTTDEGKEEGKDEGKDEGGAAADPWKAPEGSETPAEPTPPPPPEVVQPGGYPVAEIDRPLALPRMTLEPNAGFQIDFWLPDGMDNWFALTFGAGFGIIDHLEAGLNIPLTLSPDVDSYGAELYGIYEFLRQENMWLGAQLITYIPFHEQWKMMALVPFKFKLHKMFAIIADGGLGFSLGYLDYFDIKLDAGVLIQAMDALALSTVFGFEAWMISDVDDQILMPLKLRGQYTIIGDLDIFAEFSFMDLTEGADWLQMIIGAAYRIAF